VYTNNKENNMAKKLNKLSTVNESFTINRYDNGYMIEVGGRDKENDWKNCKVLCSTEAELFEVIKEALSMEMDD
jgi:hypothetical protein